MASCIGPTCEAGLSTDAWKGACVTIVRSTNNHLMAIFHGKLGKLVPDCHHFWFITARLMEVVVTTGDCNMCKVPAKSPPPTNQHPVFYRLDVLPVTQTTVSKHWMENRQQLITDIKKSLILQVDPLPLIHCKVSKSVDGMSNEAPHTSSLYTCKLYS